MKAMRTRVAAALLLLAPATATLVAPPAAAAPQRQAAVQIHSLSLNADSGLAPGSTLQFDVRATPGARVNVTLGRTDIVVPLKETAAGRYRGSYVVRRSDQIDPTALLRARATRGQTVAAHNFSYPGSFLQLAQGAAAAPAATAPRIERFTVQPVGRLEPGRELRLRVEGQPGASASFSIPGVVSEVPMREVRAGIYEGSYTVRQRDDLASFTRAEATLRAGRQWVTSRLERPFVRDNQPPVLSRLLPREGGAAPAGDRTRVSAAFDDAGSGIDRDSVRLTISGRDVTRLARIGDDEVVFRDDLPPGRHTAELTVRDLAGNVASKSWSFDVGSAMGAAPAGPLPLVVTSPGHNATVDGNGQVTVQGRTAPGATVRVRADAVTPMTGNRLGVAQTVLDASVQADGQGFFSVRVPSAAFPVPGGRYELSLTATRGAETAQERIVLHQRMG